MDNKKISKIVLPYTRSNGEEICKAIKSISHVCDIFENIRPGGITEKELSLKILQRFSVAGDVFYSKYNEYGKYISNIIFESFTKLAGILVRGKIYQDEINQLNEKYLSVLREFIDESQVANKGYDRIYSYCC